MYPFHNVPFAGRLLEVIGNGSISVSPDRLQLQIEVKTDNKNAELAEQENARTMNQLIAALQEEDLVVEPIQTAFFQVNPMYTYEDNQAQFNGFEVIHQIIVTLIDPQTAGKVIQTALKNGATFISNVVGSLKDASAYEQQALQQAVHNAQIKAGKIAEQLQVHVDPIPIKVIEQNTKQLEPFLKTATDMGTISPILPGEIQIQAQIVGHFRY